MRRAALLGAAALFITGCGENGGDDAGSGSAAPRQTITITETDFALEPSSVDLEEPGTYTFEVVNDGQVPHALEVEGEEIEEETETLQPGERATLTVTLAGGSYELYCPVGDHKDRGMVGKAVVEGSGPTPTKTTDDDSGYGY
jgi:uncharacterized cupredoxin-like copper-binding protein